MPALLKKPIVIFCTALLLCSCASQYQENYSNNIEPSPKVATPEQPPESPPGEPADANKPEDAKGPMKIGINEAILLAMENNQSPIVERMNPEIQRTFEQEELAVLTRSSAPKYPAEGPLATDFHVPDSVPKPK